MDIICKLTTTFHIPLLLKRKKNSHNSQDLISTHQPGNEIGNNPNRIFNTMPTTKTNPNIWTDKSKGTQIKTKYINNTIRSLSHRRKNYSEGNSLGKSSKTSFCGKPQTKKCNNKRGTSKICKGTTRTYYRARLPRKRRLSYSKISIAGYMRILGMHSV